MSTVAGIDYPAQVASRIIPQIRGLAMNEFALIIYSPCRSYADRFNDIPGYAGYASSVYLSNNVCIFRYKIDFTFEIVCFIYLEQKKPIPFALSHDRRVSRLSIIHLHRRR